MASEKKTGINEDLVERYFDQLKQLARVASTADIENVEALVERIRVALIVDEVSKRRKVLYRGAIDYLEDVIEERHEKEDRSAKERRRSIVSYIRGIAAGLDSDT